VPATAVQDWTSTTTTTATPATLSLNFGTAATAGTTLLVAVNSDATVATPAGYTSLVSSVHNAGCYLFGKIAAGGETGVTVTPSVAASTCLAIAEIANLSGAAITNRLDQTASAGASSGSFTWSTGTTGTTTLADEYAVAVWGYTAATTTGTDFTTGGGGKWINQTNGFTELLDIGTTKATGTNVGLCLAVRDLSATGAIESTATELNSQATPCETWVATFKAAAIVPVSPRPIRVYSQAVNRAGNY
jgi:hypothetical protein